jgi:hypothetical protein
MRKTEFEKFQFKLQAIGSLLNCEFVKLEGGAIDKCFIVAYVLKMAFERKGFKGRIVHGLFVALCKNGQSAYYGKEGTFGGTHLGEYHEWFEILHQGRYVIIDPSIWHVKVYWGLRGLAFQNLPGVVVTHSDQANSFQYIPTFTSETNAELLEKMIEYETYDSYLFSGARISNIITVAEDLIGEHLLKGENQLRNFLS